MDSFINSSATIQLMRQADGGDRAAFDQLFAAAQSDLQRYIGARLESKLRRRVDVSDIVQETHLVAFARFADYCRGQPMPFRVWLLKTAQEQVVDARRKHLLAERRSVRREVMLPDRSSLLIASPLVAVQSSPGSRVEREETQRKILEAVAALDPIDREMLLFRHVESRPYEEIALLLSIDAAAARKRYGRALLRLRAELGRRNLLDTE